MSKNITITRCKWVSDDPLYQQYHDDEWGVPLYDAKKLFAMLILEGAQAGLSWMTVLKRRRGYYAVFDQLDPEIIAQYDEARVEQIVKDSRIIRHRGKIKATIGNARSYLVLQQQGINFSDFLWQFVDHKPQINQWKSLKEVPTNTPQSGNMSKALKKTGFKFCGPTICYAFMQAVGMVNDHTTDCFRYSENIQNQC